MEMMPAYIRRLYTRFLGNCIQETRFKRSPQFFVCSPCEMHKVATPNFVHKNRNWVSPAILKTNIPRTFAKNVHRNIFSFNFIFSEIVIVVTSFIYYFAGQNFLSLPSFQFPVPRCLKGTTFIAIAVFSFLFHSEFKLALI